MFQLSILLIFFSYNGECRKIPVGRKAAQRYFVADKKLFNTQRYLGFYSGVSWAEPEKLESSHFSLEISAWATRFADFPVELKYVNLNDSDSELFSSTLGIVWPKHREFTRFFVFAHSGVVIPLNKIENIEWTVAGGVGANLLSFNEAAGLTGQLQYQKAQVISIGSDYANYSAKFGVLFRY